MKETFYFSHDYNAQFDEKILKLRRNLGLEGYGLYWCLIERLASNKGKLSIDSIEDIAYDLHINNTLITSVITEYNLFIFDNENNIFYNERLLEHFNHIEKNKKQKSEAGKKAMAKRWGNNKSVITENNTTITEDNKIKENKIKENKINNKLTSKGTDLKKSDTQINFKYLLQKNFTLDFLENIKTKYNIISEELKTETELFILYWTEKSEDGIKERREMQKTFDIRRRFYTWLAKNEKWNKSKNNNFNTGIVYTNEI